jgi:hypothetical protein
VSTEKRTKPPKKAVRKVPVEIMVKGKLKRKMVSESVYHKLTGRSVKKERTFHPHRTYFLSNSEIGDNAYLAGDPNQMVMNVRNGHYLDRNWFAFPFYDRGEVQVTVDWNDWNDYKVAFSLKFPSQLNYASTFPSQLNEAIRENFEFFSTFGPLKRASLNLDLSQNYLYVTANLTNAIPLDKRTVGTIVQAAVREALIKMSRPVIISPRQIALATWHGKNLLTLDSKSVEKFVSRYRFPDFEQSVHEPRLFREMFNDPGYPAYDPFMIESVTGTALQDPNRAFFEKGVNREDRAYLTRTVMGYFRQIGLVTEKAEGTTYVYTLTPKGKEVWHTIGEFEKGEDATQWDQSLMEFGRRAVVYGLPLAED